MSSEEKWMQLALSEAKRAYEENEVPIGCAIVLNDELLALAHNQKESKQSVLAHAEILALQIACEQQASWRLDDAELYVTLEPCAMCAAAIQQARIRKVYFATVEPKTGVVCSTDSYFEKEHLNHAVLWEKGLLENESSSLLKQFFRERRLRNKKLRQQLGGRLAKKEFMQEHGPQLKRKEKSHSSENLS